MFRLAASSVGPLLHIKKTITIIIIIIIIISDFISNKLKDKKESNQFVYI